MPWFLWSPSSAWSSAACWAGAVTIEAVYLRQGLGLRLIDAIIDRDYPVVQGLVLMSAVIYAVVNLLVDVLYTYIDPRVRLETTGS